MNIETIDISASERRFRISGLLPPRYSILPGPHPLAWSGKIDPTAGGFADLFSGRA